MVFQVVIGARIKKGNWCFNKDHLFRNWGDFFVPVSQFLIFLCSDYGVVFDFWTGHFVKGTSASLWYVDVSGVLPNKRWWIPKNVSRRSQFLLAVHGTLNPDFKNEYGVKRFTGSSGELWFRQFCFVTRFEQNWQPCWKLNSCFLAILLGTNNNVYLENTLNIELFKKDRDIIQSEKSLLLRESWSL